MIKWSYDKFRYEIVMPKSNTKSCFCIMTLYLIYSILSGCGTKGPLYIPEQRYPQKTDTQETPKAAPEASDATKNTK
jgi:predicted small lipoprotein YifL